jgi:hypothetical protein
VRLSTARASSASRTGRAIGASAAYAGFIWTTPSVEVMPRVNPGGDAALSSRGVDGYDEARDWVRPPGVHVADPVTVLGYGRGCATDVADGCWRANGPLHEGGELAGLDDDWAARVCGDVS